MKSLAIILTNSQPVGYKARGKIQLALDLSLNTKFKTQQIGFYKAFFEGED
jgi:hypothetical protein